MNYLSWYRRHVILGLLAPILFFWVPDGMSILVGVFGLHILWLVVAGRAQWQISLKSASTNAITFLRIVIVLVIALVFDGMNQWWIAHFLWCAAIMDGMDGYIARKWKTQTTFGAILDEEGDALFMLFTSLALIKGEWMPWWFFLVGWLRYVVLLWRLYFRKNDVADVKIPGARMIGGWSLGLTPLLFLLPSPFQILLGIAILMALLYSFTREISYYVRNTVDVHHL